MGFSRGFGGTPAPPQSYVTQPPGWDANWRAALADVTAAPAGILFDGDSITNGGTHVTNPFTQAFPDLVLQGLLGRGYGHYGDGYSPWAYSVSTASNTGGPTGGLAANENAPFGILGGGMQTCEGGFGRAIDSLATGSATIFQTITLPANATGFELVLISILPTGNNVGIFLDGGGLPAGATQSGSAQFTNNGTQFIYANHGPNGWGSNPVDKLIVTGLATGGHTVAIHNAGAAHAVVFAWFNILYGTPGGIMACRNGNAGALQVDIVSSQSSSNYQSRASLPQYKDRLWSGGAAGTSGTNGVWLSTNPFGYPTACNLIIDEFGGVNDNANNVAVEAFISAKNRKWRAMRRANANCSILAVLPSIPDGVTSDNTYAGNGFEGQYKEHYKQAVYKLAASYGAAVLDIDQWWGPHGVGLGYQVDGDLHPTLTGHQVIADAILAVI